VCALILAVCAIGCGASQTAKLTEVQRLRSGSIEVVLLSPRDGLRHGKDAFVIEFRSATDRNLVDAGTVRGSATMPMAGMPMFGAIDIKRTDVAGRYAADGQFEMAGTWRMSVEWQGPQGSGSITFAATVQ
jgi:hypothetical protein